MCSSFVQGKKKKSIQYVAVKSVEKNRRKKVLNEARILKSIEHRNILKFYNYYETRNHLWLIFEFWPGGDVYKMFNEDKKFPEETIKHFAFEITKGLSHLHSNGIIYGDLKPVTLLVNEYNELKLADFGNSKKITDYINPGQEGYAKSKIGSPYYMAPELFDDELGVYSFASDLWSFGWVLFEFITGKPPFTSSSFNKLIKMITEDPVPFHKMEWSNELKELVKGLLDKDPAKRILWEELIDHPYWQEYDIKELKASNFPSEPQFEAYLQKLGKSKRTPISRKKKQEKQ
jgi:serine/threonine-protein kinase ULK4